MKTTLLTMSIMIAMCDYVTSQMYFQSSAATYYYNFDTDESKIIVNTDDDIGSFCVNAMTGELYIFDNFQSVSIYDPDGKYLGINSFSSFVDAENARNIIYDHNAQQFYSTDGGTIESFGFNSDEGFSIWVSDAFGLALDTIADYLYYTLPDQNRINRVDLEGSDMQEVVYLPSGLATPTGLTLDAINNKLYWVNTGQNKIQSSDLEGNNVTDILSGLSKPKNIAINEKGTLLFITDQDNSSIIQYDLASTAIDTLVQEAFIKSISFINFDPIGQNLYWKNQYTGAISRINIQNKKQTGIIANIPYGSVDMQYDELQDYIFNLSEWALLRHSGDGSFGHLFSLPISSYFGGIALSVLDERIYITNENTIYSVDYDGQDLTELFSVDNANVYQPKVDGINRRLFWLQAGDIYSSSMDDFDAQLFYDFPNGSIGRYYLDYLNEKIYFIIDDLVYYVNFDGTGLEPIISGAAYHMVVDPINEELIYSKNNGIFKSQLNGFFEEQFLDINYVRKFTFGSTDGYLVLPVVDATALVSENTIDIEWTVTADFTGLVSQSVLLGDFEVQKRDEDGQFKTIGTVEYFSGVQSYTFIDESPQIGINEYRIRYYSDDSGLTSYTKYFSAEYLVNSAEVPPLSDLFYYSDATQSFINNAGKGTLIITNTAGQEIKKIQVENYDREIKSSIDRIGVYFYQFIMQDGRRLSEKYLQK